MCVHIFYSITIAKILSPDCRHIHLHTVTNTNTYPRTESPFVCVCGFVNAHNSLRIYPGSSLDLVAAVTIIGIMTTRWSSHIAIQNLHYKIAQKQIHESGLITIHKYKYFRLNHNVFPAQPNPPHIVCACGILYTNENVNAPRATRKKTTPTHTHSQILIHFAQSHSSSRNILRANACDTAQRVWVRNSIVPTRDLPPVSASNVPASSFAH